MCQIFTMQFADSACTQQTDFYFVSHFFFCTPFYSQVVIYRAASKSRILEVFFCAIMV